MAAFFCPKNLEFARKMIALQRPPPAHRPIIIHVGISPGDVAAIMICGAMQVRAARCAIGADFTFILWEQTSLPCSVAASPASCQGLWSGVESFPGPTMFGGPPSLQKYFLLGPFYRKTGRLNSAYTSVVNYFATIFFNKSDNSLDEWIYHWVLNQLCSISQLQQ